MNATTSLQVGQAKQMPHVISDTGWRNYVWGDIIQLRITTSCQVNAVPIFSCHLKVPESGYGRLIMNQYFIPYWTT